MVRHYKPLSYQPLCEPHTNAVHYRYRHNYPAAVDHPRTGPGRIPQHSTASWNTVHSGYALYLSDYRCNALIPTPIHAERRNVKIINAPTASQHNPYLLSEEEERSTLQKHRENRKRLRVPRRPPWTKDMTPAQLDRQEKDAFLEWRRGLAE